MIVLPFSFLNITGLLSLMRARGYADERTPDGAEHALPWPPAIIAVRQIHREEVDLALLTVADSEVAESSIQLIALCFTKIRGLGENSLVGATMDRTRRILKSTLPLAVRGALHQEPRKEAAR